MWKGLAKAGARQRFTGARLRYSRVDPHLRKSAFICGWFLCVPCDLSRLFLSPFCLGAFAALREIFFPAFLRFLCLFAAI